jgi:hypothetical protein
MITHSSSSLSSIYIDASRDDPISELRSEFSELRFGFSELRSGFSVLRSGFGVSASNGYRWRTTPA